MRAVAIVCARNEDLHIEACLSSLGAEGVEAILIDHDSADDTVAIARGFLGAGLLAIEHLPFDGVFALEAVLAAKRAIAARLEADWLLHLDADEWPQSPVEGEPLLAGLERADAAGSNCVDFEEFVFVPAPGQSYEAVDYRTRMLDYYLYQPRPQRLMRAWKKSAGLSNVAGGGHKLAGARTRVHAERFPLRHYICLSQRHARAKFLGRRFDPVEVTRGWHANRVGLTPEMLTLREGPALRRLASWQSKRFRRDAPQRLHFWQW